MQIISLEDRIKHKTMKIRRTRNLGKAGIKKTVAFSKKYTLIINCKCPTCSEDVQF